VATVLRVKVQVIDTLQALAVACSQWGFQLGDPGFQRRNVILDLGGGEARGDVLQAVLQVVSSRRK